MSVVLRCQLVRLRYCADDADICAVSFYAHITYRSSSTRSESPHESHMDAEK